MQSDLRCLQTAKTQCTNRMALKGLYTKNYYVIWTSGHDVTSCSVVSAIPDSKIFLCSLVYGACVLTIVGELSPRAYADKERHNMIARDWPNGFIIWIEGHSTNPAPWDCEIASQRLFSASILLQADCASYQKAKELQGCCIHYLWRFLFLTRSSEFKLGVMSQIFFI